MNTGSIAISALICTGEYNQGPAVPHGADWAAIGSRYKYLVHQCNGLDECLDCLVYPEVWSSYEKETHSLHGELGRIGLSVLQTPLSTQMMQGGTVSPGGRDGPSTF